MEYRTEYKIDCGRTQNRGSWVSVSKDGYSIQLSDNHERRASQIQLRDKAIQLLEEWMKEKEE